MSFHWVSPHLYFFHQLLNSFFCLSLLFGFLILLTGFFFTFGMSVVCFSILLISKAQDNTINIGINECMLFEIMLI